MSATVTRSLSVSITVRTGNVRSVADPHRSSSRPAVARYLASRSPCLRFLDFAPFGRNVPRSASIDRIYELTVLVLTDEKLTFSHFLDATSLHGQLPPQVTHPVRPSPSIGTAGPIPPLVFVQTGAEEISHR